MKWIIIVLLMVIAILMVVCYALLVAASNADKDEHEMYQEWKKKYAETPSEITTCVGIAVALLDDEHELYEAWKERQKDETD